MNANDVLGCIAEALNGVGPDSTMDWTDEAKAVLDALKAAGYAVVELPDVAELHRRGITFSPGADCANDCCQAEVIDESTGISYSLDGAREHAADLLAAAAEASK